MSFFRSLFLIAFVVFGSQAFAQYIPMGFFKKTITADPCDGTPARGTVCSGGAIYAGEFDGGKYMITPGNCNDSSTPTCNGGTDSLTKTWRGSSGSDSDIPGVENVTNVANPSSSSFRGHVNTPAIVAHASTSSDSAADYCNDMTFGGYSDWYLPSKSELAYIYCHTNVSGHNPSFPQEDPNCVSYGGKTSELIDFANTNYWSSTEDDADEANIQSFMSAAAGAQGDGFKNTSYGVRCVRREFLCPGTEIGGYCWYMGAGAQNCNTVCSGQGLTCDLVGTRDYAGSAGSDANCDEVLDALLGAGSLGSGTSTAGMGCSVAFGTRRRITTPVTNCSDMIPNANYSRACACTE